MDAEVIWTDLTATDVAERLAKLGSPVSVHVVEQLFQAEGFGRRQAQKCCTMGEHPDRNAQFLRIAEFKKEYLDSLNPVLSIDTKKKELLGNFYRDGKLLTKKAVGTFDHDFPRFADGVVIPHGLYDLKLNRGYLHLGTSHDTSEFACDALEDWWWRFGRDLYPEATSLLLLCDGGGSNTYRHFTAICSGRLIVGGDESAPGDPNRGARYNSALRYVKKNAECIVVVVSEDKIVNILPE